MRENQRKSLSCSHVSVSINTPNANSDIAMQSKTPSIYYNHIIHHKLY